VFAEERLSVLPARIAITGNPANPIKLIRAIEFALGLKS
jgi:Ni,Fe-hydrogenase III small subunit